ncbi:putative nuclease HARBI1 isoform X4 [Helianthus annuus]|uniref:putative nuclease HARBI1 isoform X4 n=1 Tax=Helianthus annuus TaxID=4232 RepID=UPI001653193A|nr:putative nuclease HARBI1 isoform X4 [Helianthus annuus]
MEKRSTLLIHLPSLKPLTLALKNPIYQTPIYHLSSIQKICLKWSNTNLFSYTEDCIGAIDGTHVRASVREHEQPKYIGRKGYATQNIMAACDFNMCFTFAWAGWEGAAHDTRIFNEALRRPEINFPHPIGDFRRGKTVASRAPRGPKEIFNYHHSSLRNVIERTFGVWKARWEILQHMHINYTYETQVKIVLASMAIHNYIRKKDTCDEGFTMAEQESYTPNNGRGSNDINEVNEDTSTQHRIDDLYMSAVRDMIAGDLTKPR